MYTAPPCFYLVTPKFKIIWLAEFFAGIFALRPECVFAYVERSQTKIEIVLRCLARHLSTILVMQKLSNRDARI